MCIDKNQYIGLYSIAMEEARHRDRLYTQTWMAVAITGSVFFAAAALFWEKYSLPSGWWIGVIMIVVGLIFGGFFTWSIFRLAVEGDICRDVAKKIEGVLMGNEERLKDLLVLHKIDDEVKQKPLWRKRIWHILCKQRCRWVYPGTIFAAWIAFWIFLFIGVN